MATYKIGSKITHESLEGEVIAIHFDTGAYYSLRDSAARIWEALAASVGGAEDIASLFEGSDTGTVVLVETFLESLGEEGLVEKAEVIESKPTGEESLSIAQAFEKPTFERFDDMRDLLLADPIHEVDAGGWPHVEA